MTLPSWGKFAVSILICFVAAGIGSLFTASSVSTWYQTLTRPAFTPPSWVFGPAWTVLYLLMGVALFVVWNSGQPAIRVRPAVTVFLIQLALNAAWSGLFFGLRSPVAGLIEIAVLWLAILVTIVYFWRVTPVAAILLIPYLLWVSFASVLNFTIWSLN